ncbi:hypothetical protein CORC01_00074 [Colletotrichum orchidophilum]|uniref:Uncharacterized protein n=1 Tax=Colletotrichum orchidophilum TaxID=1209926 RepID=A0A1G4BT88_9PEZI|nr:uncharacterized protein CORC01_00074 [Colletotrichum orchidophilum]OHF04603.1 hypothetical protein CORC01_00074 [Colletotrichum orchidophilum]
MPGHSRRNPQNNLLGAINQVEAVSTDKPHSLDISSILHRLPDAVIRALLPLLELDNEAFRILSGAAHIRRTTEAFARSRKVVGIALQDIEAASKHVDKLDRSCSDFQMQDEVSMIKRDFRTPQDEAEISVEASGSGQHYTRATDAGDARE